MFNGVLDFTSKSTGSLHYLPLKSTFIMLEDEDVDVKPKITESDDWTTPGNFHGKSLTDEVKTVEVSASSSYLLSSQN